MNYKYLTETTLAKIDDDGISRGSCSIEHPEYLAWLAEGNTPEPADVPPPPTVQQQLVQLDADNALTQRNLREFILLAAQAFKLGQPIDIMAIPGVAKVAQVEAEAQALRAAL